MEQTTVEQAKLVVAFPNLLTHQIGGPATFQGLLIGILKEKGHKIVYANERVKPDIIFIISGTSKFLWLLKNKLRGSKIVQRLDGINWRYRIFDYSKKVKFLQFYRNHIINFIRKYLSNHIVYQSKFVNDVWKEEFGKTSCPYSIIYNGTNIDKFKPVDKKISSTPTILCVEGSIQDDAYSVRFITRLAQLVEGKYKILLCGRIDQKTQDILSAFKAIEVRGVVPKREIVAVYQQADVFLCLEFNAPCPNSVIEALASGLPVVGFDTGALKELVPEEAGILIPYEGSIRKMYHPDVEKLAQGIDTVIDNWLSYSKNARQTAIKRFNIKQVIESYLDVFLVNRKSLPPASY